MEKARETRRRIARYKRLEASGYEIDGKGALVHRTVCWKHHGPFNRKWVVHHVDQNPKNNEPSNLIAMPRKLHDSIHKIMRRDKMQYTRDMCAQAIKNWRSPTPPNEPEVFVKKCYHNINKLDLECYMLELIHYEKKSEISKEDVVNKLAELIENFKV